MWLTMWRVPGGPPFVVRAAEHSIRARRRATAQGRPFRIETSANAMTYRETCLLLPCHSIEDFPMHQEGPDADGLLAAWTSLWHPALLAATERSPAWCHASVPPQDATVRLVLVPGGCQAELPPGYADQVHQHGGRLLAGNRSRAEILEAVLPAVAEHLPRLNADLAADYLALGYAFLQVQLLTRQMRYATNLDEPHFFRQAVAGAVAAVQGDDETARNKLVACLDLLSQERDNYYAVDAFVLDLTLLAPQALGQELRELVTTPVPSNLLVTGGLARKLQTGPPEILEAVRHGLREGHLGLLGGEDEELPGPLLHCETWLRQLRTGIAAVEQVLAGRPRVYGRYRFGLTTALPHLLTRLGYVGALHTALDGGRVPAGSQIKSRWEGLGQTTIDAVSRAPLNAARPETFLSYASKLGETMDMDHIATLCLAHFPGQATPWYHDLRRIARYSGLLGRFVTVDQYFRDSEYPTQLDRFRADQYQSPYLIRAVRHDQADPISGAVRYWQHRTRLLNAHTLTTLTSLLAGRPRPELAQLTELADAVDRAIERPDSGPTAGQVLEAERAAAEGLAEALPRAASPAANGYLVLNPLSTVRRTVVAIPALDPLPAVDNPVYAAAGEGDRRLAVVDVPPLGFVWLHSAAPPTVVAPATPLLAEEGRLLNEFFAAHIDPASGALSGLYQHDVRGNRLSQQLAFRSGRPAARRPADGRAAYSQMVADQVRVTQATSTCGEITSAGRLVNRAGDTLATFRQVYRVHRGSRVLQITMELDPHLQPTDDPWNSYYACRFAWASDGAAVWRGVNLLREHGDAKRLEAPTYIEIEEGKHRTTLLTGGLPYHRRTGPRLLDSLLIVRGERARNFQVGVGIDVRHPVQEAVALLAPPPAVHQTAPPPTGARSGWLFHLDHRNVVATHWSPRVEDDQVCGVRVRLLETLGRTTQTCLHGFRAFGTAERLDFTGKSLGPLEVRDGAVHLRLEPNDWMELEATWL